MRRAFLLRSSLSSFHPVRFHRCAKQLRAFAPCPDTWLRVGEANRMTEVRFPGTAIEWHSVVMVLLVVASLCDGPSSRSR